MLSHFRAFEATGQIPDGRQLAGRMGAGKRDDERPLCVDTASPQQVRFRRPFRTLRDRSAYRAPAANGRFVRSANLRPPKMLRHGRMAGQVKLRRGSGSVGRRRLLAASFWRR